MDISYPVSASLWLAVSRFDVGIQTAPACTHTINRQSGRRHHSVGVRIRLDGLDAAVAERKAGFGQRTV